MGGGWRPVRVLCGQLTVSCLGQRQIIFVNMQKYRYLFFYLQIIFGNTKRVYCLYRKRGIQKYSMFSNEIWKIYIFLFLELFFCCHKRVGMLESMVTKALTSNDDKLMTSETCDDTP